MSGRWCTRVSLGRSQSVASRINAFLAELKPQSLQCCSRVCRSRNWHHRGLSLSRSAVAVGEEQLSEDEQLGQLEGEGLVEHLFPTQGTPFRIHDEEVTPGSVDEVESQVGHHFVT